jgi:hypothetical protein
VTRTSRHFAAIVALATLAAACGLLETPPAFKLDLSDTTWALVEIDGRATDPGAGATLNIIGLDDVVLQTRCRTITGRLVLDSDGSGWGVVNPVAGASRCSGDEAAAEQGSVDAFLAAEEWAVLSDTEIELRGSHVLTLTRLGGG